MRLLLASQRVDEHSARRERRDGLDQAWTAFARACGLVLLPVPNRTADAASLAQGVSAHALLLTGGNDVADAPGALSIAPERDATERALLGWAMDHRRPVLAVCRGFQLLNAALGGRLRPVEGHVGGMHALDWRADAPPGLARLADVNTFHNTGIGSGDLAPGLEALASAPDGSIEAARHADLPILAVMWHPERPPAVRDEAMDVLARHLQGGGA